MDFKSVLDVFSGSFFSDDYVGDLSEIQQRLVILELEASGDAVHPEQKAWLNLLQSVFQMLRGNLTKAFELIDQLSHIGGLPPKWHLRAVVYHAFYESLRRYPSIIRFKPELGGPTAGFRNIELGFSEMIHTYQKTLADYFKTDLPLFRLEAEVLQHTMLTSLFLWNNAFLQHPSYPKGPWESMKKSTKKYLNQRMNLSQHHRDVTAKRGMHQLSNYLTRLDVELEYGQSPEAASWVEDLKSRFKESDDRHNLAVMKMLEADYILSPPFSNPIALNLIVYEGSNPEISVTGYDSLEGELKLGDTQAAGNLYYEAYDLFVAAVSPRGQAAVRLRQGCVEHLLACPGNISREEKGQRYEAARQKFMEAVLLFDLDEVHIQIVRGHQILLDISSGHEQNIIQAAADIGRWGHASKNELVSQFVGNLMLRFGRRQKLVYAQNDIALKCFRCARACFMALGDRFGLFRAMNFETSLLESVDDSLAARSLINKQKDLLRELGEYIDNMSKDHPDQKSNFYALRIDMMSIFHDLISNAYHKFGAAEALIAWKKEYKEIRNRKDMRAFTDEAFKNTSLDKYLFEDDVSIQSYRDGMALAEFAALVQQRMDDYWEKNELWRAHLRNLDIDEAEGVLRNYIKKTAPEGRALGPDDYGPVFAAVQLADFELARNLFNAMPDRKFVGDKLNDYAVINSTQHLTIQKRLQYTHGLDNGLALSALSHDWSVGYRILRHIEKSIPIFFDDSSADRSTPLWKRLSMAGIIYENANEPLKAFTSWLRASQLAEQERSLTSDVTARRGIFSTWMFADIFTGLARLSLRADDINLPLAVLDGHSHNHSKAKNWKEHALLFVEKAKARSLLDAFATQPLASTTGNERLTRAHKRRLRMALLGQPKLLQKEKEELASLEAELKGFEDELDPLMNPFPSSISSINPEDLYRAIASDELVIEVDFSSDGFTLFGITSQGIEFTQHRQKTYAQIRRPVIRTLKHLYDYPNQDKDIKTSKLKKDLDMLLREISDELVIPVAHLIREKKHAIFITSQPLTAFPFSILPFDNGEPLFLHAAVSQTPSLSTLMQLSKSRKVSTTTSNVPISVHAIAKIAKFVPPEQDEEVEIPLSMAAIEAMVIAHMFDSWPIEGSTVSRSKFVSLMMGKEDDSHQNSSKSNDDAGPPQGVEPRVLHISSHGSYDPVSPWMSHLSLQDKVRVLDVMAPSSSTSPHHNTSLVVFAACLSGMGEGTLGNDVLGFAHAVLEGGCAAYLGVLWRINDTASMLLMCVFYRLLRETSGMCVARLWQEAQKFLYCMDKDDGRKLVDELVRELEGAERDGCKPEVFVRGWRKQLGKLGTAFDCGHLDFKHPFFVGAFVVVGFGGMVLR